MPVPHTVLGQHFGFSRKAQVNFFYKKFGKEKILPFLLTQVHLPLQWLKILSFLDDQNKSWNWILEMDGMIHYRLHFQHLSARKQWKIIFELRYQDLDHKATFLYKDKDEFYKYVLFCLIRMPKRHLLMTTLNSGRIILLENEQGWNKSSIDVVREKLGMTGKQSSPTHLGFTLDANFLTEFWNSRNKKQLLQSILTRD